MNKNWLSKTLKLGVLISIASLFLVSVGWAASDFSSLKKDRISKTYYTSVFFGRVRFINEVKKFSPYGRSLRFQMNNNLESKKTTFSFPIKPRTESWKEANASGYDTRFAAEFVDGNYFLNKVEVKFDEYKLPTSMVNEDNCYLENNMLSFPIEKPCILGENSLIYLGVIEVRLMEIKIMGGNQFTCSYTVNMRDNDFEKDLAQFKMTYPKIYEQFKGKIIKNPWKITANNLIME